MSVLPNLMRSSTTTTALRNYVPIVATDSPALDLDTFWGEVETKNRASSWAFAR